MSQTNETTSLILADLFKRQIFAWRQNVAPIPLPNGGFRPAAKKGVSDIIAILPPIGIFLGVEIKSGRDKLRPEQIGFISNVKKMGGNVLVVKDFPDFQSQFDNYLSTVVK